MPTELEIEECIEYDGCGLYSNDDTVVWYDTSGMQHISFLSDYILEDFDDVYDLSILEK